MATDATSRSDRLPLPGQLPADRLLHDRLGDHVPIYALGDQVPNIHGDAYVHPDAVIIGSVTIGARSSVWPCAVLRGDDGEIIVGEDSSVQDGAVVHTTPPWPTRLGDRVTVGHNAHLEGCTVEDRALIGSGSIVLHRAVVGREAIVGAGAFVGNDKIVPPLAMALGIPATIREAAVQPGHFDHGVESYVWRGDRYRRGLRRLPERDRGPEPPPH